MQEARNLKIKEIQVKINSLIELHAIGIMSDENFYSDVKAHMNLLDTLNADMVVVKDKLILCDSKPEEEAKDQTVEPKDEECQIDKILKNLQ